MLHTLFDTIEQFFRAYALEVPLEWFVFIGSFAEEVISPIPSALIMGIAGSLALLDHRAVSYLVWLALIGNLGKTIGAWLYYFLGDKLEDWLVRPIGKYLGVKHEDIESIGQRFSGHHLKDGGILFLLRVIPFVPSTPVSIAAGIIKMDQRVFMTATYLGNFFKDLLYLYIGYVGLAKLHTLWRDIIPVKIATDIVFMLFLFFFLLFLYLYRGHGQRLMKYCERCAHRWLQKVRCYWKQ
ncbi:MAG: DedA family protein [Minisyncoccota bacterium]